MAPSEPPKSVVSLPSPEKLVSSTPNVAVAGEGEVAAPGLAYRDDLVVAFDATPVAPFEPPKSVVCLASPEKAVIDGPVGVVADESEVAGVGLAHRDDLAVS